MVHPAGVEPAAYGIGIRHSIQLSYECKMWWDRQRLFKRLSVFRAVALPHLIACVLLLVALVSRLIVCWCADAMPRPPELLRRPKASG